MPPNTGARIARATLTASALFALLGAFLVAPAAPVAAQTPVPAAVTTRTATLEASGLTYTDSRHASANYSNRSTVRVSKARYTGYLSFPAVDLQPGEAITGATLVLTVTKATSARKGGLVVVPVASAWNSLTLTRRAAPAALGGRLGKAVRARKGHTSTFAFTASQATRFLAGGAALRVRHSKAGATVLIAKTGAAAPTLRVTVAVPGTTPSTPDISSAPFSIAVLPDTQMETTRSTNPRFANRTQWLVDQRAALNLKYVLHTGDVVNWGWLVPSQFGVATRAVKKLADAGIPYALTIGNHDTAAVGWNGKAGSSAYGGSAYARNPECPTRLGLAECRSRLLVRRTSAFNQNFPLASIRSVGGAYEVGKVDNIWTTFEASGTKWLVLTLELWPRAGAVDWASRVVESHPSHNVIVQTHSYLTESGAIVQTAGGYGATSGQYVFDNLIKKHANIKLVFSGHTGSALKRVDTGTHGNRIVSYLQAFHSTSTNPVRIVLINPASGVVTTRIYAPYTNQSWPQYSTTDTITLIR